jgi:hypothetical protein
VVVRPASNGRSSREAALEEERPSNGGRRVIIRQAPARTFRIFESGDDDD